MNNGYEEQLKELELASLLIQTMCMCSREKGVSHEIPFLLASMDVDLWNEFNAAFGAETVEFFSTFLRDYPTESLSKQLVRSAVDTQNLVDILASAAKDPGTSNTTSSALLQLVTHILKTSALDLDRLSSGFVDAVLSLMASHCKDENTVLFAFQALLYTGKQEKYVLSHDEMKILMSQLKAYESNPQIVIAGCDAVYRALPKLKGTALTDRISDANIMLLIQILKAHLHNEIVVMSLMRLLVPALSRSVFQHHCTAQHVSVLVAAYNLHSTIAQPIASAICNLLQKATSPLASVASTLIPVLMSIMDTDDELRFPALHAACHCLKSGENISYFRECSALRICCKIMHEPLGLEPVNLLILMRLTTKLLVDPQSCVQAHELGLTAVVVNVLKEQLINTELWGQSLLAYSAVTAE
jgi:hypothetical protein